MDIYKQLINKNASESKTVNVGRLSAFIALIIATIMAPLLGGIDQAFQFIQEYTGIVSPGILSVFVLGLFWKKTSNKGAVFGALASIPIALFFKPLSIETAIACLFSTLNILTKINETIIEIILISRAGRIISVISTSLFLGSSKNIIAVNTPNNNPGSSHFKVFLDLTTRLGIFSPINKPIVVGIIVRENI